MGCSLPYPFPLAVSVQNRKLDGGCDWARSKVSSLARCREAMWSAVKGMGGVMGEGAFYFLVPVPVGEDRAIDVLAKRWEVLTTPGRWALTMLKLPPRESLPALLPHVLDEPAQLCSLT